jgi:transcription elongation factor Elf1
MASQPADTAEVGCRLCGSTTLVEIDGDDGTFALTCGSCGRTTEGRYREDGVIVWG